MIIPFGLIFGEMQAVDVFQGEKDVLTV